jgi:hypothetical protein
MKRAMTILTSALALLASGVVDTRAAEHRTVKAMSAWVGQGRIVPTGTDEVYFVGAFRGTIFVENAEGGLHAGRILCPGTLEVNVASGAQRGQGRCVISRNDTDQVFARWSCSGTHGVECRGAFELTGGTGRFSGIRGTSDFRIRTGTAEFAAGRGSEVIETGAGLAEWPSLSYTIP